MGQQQLLLIVLGVIIVGIAIVVGINLFNANAEESAKDTMASEGTNLAALAQQFYKNLLHLVVVEILLMRADLQVLVSQSQQNYKLLVLVADGQQLLLLDQ